MNMLSKLTKKGVVPSQFRNFAAINKYLDFKTKPNLFDRVDRKGEKTFPLKVSKKELISHDTYLFELEFPFTQSGSSDWISGVWPGGHFVW